MTSLFQRFSARLLLITPIMLSALLFLTGCATDKASIISKNELADQIRSENPPTIVDVRSSDEYDDGHIPGAIHIPYWAALTRHSKIPSTHQEPLIIYCEHGPRAKMAKLAFWIIGFQEIRYLEGHMSSWKKANMQLEKSTPP